MVTTTAPTAGNFHIIRGHSVLDLHTLTLFGLLFMTAKCSGVQP